MKKQIKIKIKTVDDFRNNGLVNLAQHLEDAGFASEVDLLSEITWASARYTRTGKLVFVTGSRSLFDRYCRENNI